MPRVKILKPAPEGLTELPASFTVAKLGQEAIAAVDDLVEMVAAYGYEYRTEAEATVVAARLAMIIAGAVGLLAGLALAIGFGVLPEQADQHAGEVDAGTG